MKPKEQGQIQIQAKDTRLVVVRPPEIWVDAPLPPPATPSELLKMEKGYKRPQDPTIGGEIDAFV